MLVDLQLALYLSGARIGSVQAFFRVPRLYADLATLPQLVPRIDRYPYRVTSCAEPCKTARIQRFQFIFQSIKPLSSPFPQNAAPCRGLRYFSATRPRPRQLRLPSYAARESIHDCSHAQIALHLLRVEASTFNRFLSMPHATAPLTTQRRRGPRPDNYDYQISRRAEACTTARTLIGVFILAPKLAHSFTEFRQEPVSIKK